MMTWSRRRFVQGLGMASLGLLAGCARVPGQAQPSPAKLHRLGWLAAGSAEHNDWLSAFREGLRDLGYLEGRDVSIEYHDYGETERLPAVAAALVNSRVDVIVTHGGNNVVRAIKDRTATIPIVCLTLITPVEAGLVASLARPGGNLTGMATLAEDLIGKKLELLKETMPEIRYVAAIWNPAEAGPNADANFQTAAASLGLQLQSVPVHGADQFDSAFATIVRGQAEAITLLGGRLIATNGTRIAEFSIQNRLPGIGQDRRFAQAGGLLAYAGVNPTRMARRGAYYVDRILKGTPPADLPVEQPREFDFVINLKTAQALGLTIPHHVLLQATEIIQ